MNKYIWLLIAVAVIVGGSIAFKSLAPEGGNGSCPLTGETKTFTITALKDEWAFEPEAIDVNCGDKVVMTVVNEDDYDHGIAIEQFGVSQRMPASSTITLDFIAVKPGDFQFICSVPCGEGEVAGMHRGHFDMVGTIKVKNLIQTR